MQMLEMKMETTIDEWKLELLLPIAPVSFSKPLSTSESFSYDVEL